MNQIVAKLRLLPHREKRLLSGHPWLYSNEAVITSETKSLPVGSLGHLESSRGEFLGTALLNPQSLIVARLISRQPLASLERGFFIARLNRALMIREAHFSAPFYRLIHAEADGLPGMIIDRYGAVVVVQFNNSGCGLYEDETVAALCEVLAPSAIVVRNESRGDLAMRLALGSLALGSLPEAGIALVENDTQFSLDLMHGQKTGWFYDQRNHRALVARIAAKSRLRVLDVFSYLGGFGIEAVVAGAASALLVDRSLAALDGAARAATLNQCSDKISYRCGDGFAVIAELAAAKEQFGMVVADPPAFVQSQKDLTVGLKAYRKLVREAAGLVAPNGYLFVASCSHNVTAADFAACVAEGLHRSGRSGRFLYSGGADYDHPTHPHLAESAYLKGILVAVD